MMRRQVGAEQLGALACQLPSPPTGDGLPLERKDAAGLDDFHGIEVHDLRMAGLNLPRPPLDLVPILELPLGHALPEGGERLFHPCRETTVDRLFLGPSRRRATQSVGLLALRGG